MEVPVTHLPPNKHWQVPYGDIVVMGTEEHPTKCQFTLKPFTNKPVMFQKIDLTHFDNRYQRSYNIEYQAHMSNGPLIELTRFD